MRKGGKGKFKVAQNSHPRQTALTADLSQRRVRGANQTQEAYKAHKTTRKLGYPLKAGQGG